MPDRHAQGLGAPASPLGTPQGAGEFAQVHDLDALRLRCAEHARAAHNGSLPEYVTLRLRRYGKSGGRWEASNGTCTSSYPRDAYDEAVIEAWWLTFCEDDAREREAAADRGGQQ